MPKKLSDTQPTNAKPKRKLDPGGTTTKRIPIRKIRFRSLFWFLVFSGFFLLIVFIGSAYFGFTSGQHEGDDLAATQQMSLLAEQYVLGVHDMEAGNLELAKERFEFILNTDPSFQPAIDRLVEVMLTLNATATPTPLPPATATPDLRPVEELYNHAQELIAARSWDAALDTLAALRKAEPTYKMIETDGMIYLALRNRGIDRIVNRGELEGGLYDFSLAENFGPLDHEADNYRLWARLYLLGNAFWKAYPQTAAYYYGQLVSVAPALTDGTGMTAFYRYWTSVLQYAEILVEEEQWCEAADQYRILMDALVDDTYAITATAVYDTCLGTIYTPTGTSTATASETPTGTYIFTTSTYTPTFTPGAGATATPTFTSGAPVNTPTPTQTPSVISTPTPTNTSSPPTNTPIPSNTPAPSSTPTP